MDTAVQAAAQGAIEERYPLLLLHPMHENKVKQFGPGKHGTQLRCGPHDNLCFQMAESKKQMVSVSSSENVVQKYLFVEYT